MKRLLTLLTLLILTTAAIAQDRITISGKVLDKSNGDPLIGVNIVQQGTTNGTISDIDGKFSLNVDRNSTVLISYIGYKAQEFVANSEKEFKILLEESQVVGFSPFPHEDLVGIAFLSTEMEIAVGDRQVKPEG